MSVEDEEQSRYNQCGRSNNHRGDSTLDTIGKNLIAMLEPLEKHLM